jgi:hypothetical protein
MQERNQSHSVRLGTKDAACWKYSLKLFFPTPGPMHTRRERGTCQQQPRPLLFYVKRGQEARRFIQQIELYPIKRQKAHFTAIEM